MFSSPHFTFNGIYSKDMNVCIATMDNDMFYEIGVEYSSNIEVETNSVEYNPYFVESPSEVSEIELVLLLYNPYTMETLSVDRYDMEEIYSWLITDNFAPFISDDEDIIYYFKITKLSKVLTLDGKGYLRATFKPYSKYCYRKIIHTKTVSSSTTLEIYNYSRLIYKPIIEVTNLGTETTVNKINDMEITGLKNNETVKIDNLTKLILDGNNENKFSCCNAKWVQLEPKKYNNLTLSGNCSIKVICEFPILK